MADSEIIIADREKGYQAESADSGGKAETEGSGFKVYLNDTELDSSVADGKLGYYSILASSGNVSEISTVEELIGLNDPYPGQKLDYLYSVINGRGFGAGDLKLTASIASIVSASALVQAYFRKTYFIGSGCLGRGAIIASLTVVPSRSYTRAFSSAFK